MDSTLEFIHGQTNMFPFKVNPRLQAR